MDDLGVSAFLETFICGGIIHHGQISSLVDDDNPWYVAGHPALFIHKFGQGAQAQASWATSRAKARGSARA